MQAWSRLGEQNPDVRVVFAMEKMGAESKQLCSQYESSVDVVHDPEGRTAASYNARWRPRAYLIDEAGQLAYVQPDTVLDPFVPNRVRQVMGRAQ